VSDVTLEPWKSSLSRWSKSSRKGSFSDSPVGFIISIASRAAKTLILISKSWLRRINQRTYPGNAG